VDELQKHVEINCSEKKDFEAFVVKANIDKQKNVEKINM